MIKKYAHVAGLLLLGMALLFFDFVSKAYVYHVLSFSDACEGLFCIDRVVFKDWCGIDCFITLTKNTGAAWGFFSNFQIALLVFRIAVISGMFLYLFFWNKQPEQTTPLVLVLAGALGNVIDFFLYGFVVDFLQFNLWGYHFPVFNFADICITIGVSWLFAVSLKSRKRKYASF